MKILLSVPVDGSMFWPGKLNKARGWKKFTVPQAMEALSRLPVREY